MQEPRVRNRTSIEGGERRTAPRLRRDRRTTEPAATAPATTAAETAERPIRVLHVVGREDVPTRRRTSFAGSGALRRDRRVAAFVTLDERRERLATDDEISVVVDAERHHAIVSSWTAAGAGSGPQGVDAGSDEAQREFLAKRAERERREVLMLAERLQAFADRVAREAS